MCLKQKIPPALFKNGHLDFLLKIVKTLGEALVVEGQNHDEVISTFLEPLTDDDFKTLEAHLKKCKRGDKKKEAKFVPKIVFIILKIRLNVYPPYEKASKLN